MHNLARYPFAQLMALRGDASFPAESSKKERNGVSCIPVDPILSAKLLAAGMLPRVMWAFCGDGRNVSFPCTPADHYVHRSGISEFASAEGTRVCRCDLIL